MSIRASAVGGSLHQVNSAPQWYGQETIPMSVQMSQIPIKVLSMGVVFTGSPFPDRGLASVPGPPPSRAVVAGAGNTPSWAWLWGNPLHRWSTSARSLSHLRELQTGNAWLPQACVMKSLSYKTLWLLKTCY